jgi:acyl-CoA synthetase (AMP-forming)/AMP-acid ligase II
MMDSPLLVSSILAHAVKNHPRRGVVSRDGADIVRFTYAAFGERVAQLANALRRLGIEPGDRVASFGWNSHRHLELYYAVPSMGAVLHTVNIRLFPEQIAGTIAHAADRIVFVDGSLVGAVRAAIGADPALAECRFVIMGPADATLPNAVDYEALIAGEAAVFDWPRLDENSAAVMCFTSATTADPKAVLFSHRSTFLHALATAATDVFGLAERDVCLPIVPMFHVNAWGLPFVCPLVGASLVMPGARLDPAGLIELVEAESVTFSAGVPTVWFALRDALRARGAGLPTLERVVIGGSAVPPALFDDLEALGTKVIHAWGMTEMSPIGTVSTVTAELTAALPDVRRRERFKQGPFSVIVDWKELWVRGPAVAASYYNNESASATAFIDGWFRTGDIVTVDDFGFMEIVDRSKDLVNEDELRAWLGERIAKWWIPDRVMFLDAIPRTGVGKFLKRELRERFANLLTSGEDVVAQNPSE